MTNPFDRNPNSEFIDSDDESQNLLWEYVRSLEPEVVSHLSKPGSTEVVRVMERNIVGLLGSLPPEHFGVSVTTSRENLGRLLASAMISGYFLRNVEQRLDFEQSVRRSPSPRSEDTED